MMMLSNFSLKYLPKLTLMLADRNQQIVNHSFAIRKLDICVRTSLKDLGAATCKLVNFLVDHKVQSPLEVF